MTMRELLSGPANKRLQKVADGVARRDRAKDENRSRGARVQNAQILRRTSTPE